MDLQRFYLKRQELLAAKPKYRELCRNCMQPDFGCYCEHVQTFDSRMKFVILIHPIEVRRRIATGRMSHLVLKNSELIKGQDYTENERVNEILNDPGNQCMILYPGRLSKNITRKTGEAKSSVIESGKKPVLFVIDGTWATARRTMRQSLNLKSVPRICFTPPGPSNFRVRKQPKPECYSTIEAIHHTVELLGPDVGFDVSSREHDKLLFVFDKMVERQLEFVRKSLENPNANAYRRPRFRQSQN